MQTVKLWNKRNPQDYDEWSGVEATWFTDDWLVVHFPDGSRIGRRTELYDSYSITVDPVSE
jgi:hypothetical protein